MDKYIDILNDINQTIKMFNNQFLKSDYDIELLDETRYRDSNYLTEINDKEWHDFQFPRNPAVGGVYFYFGYD